MQCPQCQHENLAGQKFCGECGARLTSACPSCGTSNPPTQKFCGECGTGLAQTDGTAKYGTPQSYTPKHLADKILTSRAALEGERKRVTVLFCDIVGSTTLAERIGEEAMHECLNNFFTLALAEVHRYEGTINQFLGDGFMALFGAPIAHEDHARRAVLAAVGLQRAIRERPTELGLPGGEALTTRAGLNTGIVVVGAIGDNLRMDYTAVGDTTNLAARLQQMAPPGSIFLGEATERLVRSEVQSEALLDVQVKGKTQPVTVYKVTGLKPRRSPLAGRDERTLSPMLGRERELATLQELVDQTGRRLGQVVGVVGEPGLGKSRLLHEFRQALAGQQITYLEGRCVSYGGNVPYLPVLDIIRANCAIAEHDTPQEVGQKVRAALAEVGMDAESSVPYLLRILGIKEGTEELAGHTPESVKARTTDTLLRMSIQGSQRRPIIFVVEDLHWVDRPTEEYLGSLIESLSRAAILLLITYRPGYRPPWLDKSYATQLALRPLSVQQSLELVRSTGLHDSHDLPAIEHILEKAEGNPFFLEELTQVVRDQDGRSSAIAVPETIQGVLGARIDRLEDESKHVLQTASVLGRTFPLRLLEAIWKGPGEVGIHLGTLKRLEFLYESSGPGDNVYAFKHALTQEVAYESLLTANRRVLHWEAGKALEELYATSQEAVYDRLAHHYSRAGEPRKALEYLTRLAAKAAGGHAHEEALAILREAEGHAKSLPADEGDRATVQLGLRQANSLHFLGRRQALVDLLLGHQECLDRLDDHELAGPYHFTLGFAYSFLGNREGASSHIKRAFAAATASNDRAILGKVNVLVAMERGWSGQLKEGLALGKKAVALLEPTAERSWLGFAYYVIALCSDATGDFYGGLEATSRLAKMAADIGDRRLESNAAGVTGLILADMGEIDRAIEECQRAIDLSPDDFERAVTLGYLGYAHLEGGDVSQALTILERALERAKHYRSPQIQTQFATFLAEAYLATDQVEKARDAIVPALRAARTGNNRLGVGLALRMMGLIAKASGALDEAGTVLAEALETFRSTGEAYHVARVHLDLAMLRAARKQDTAARGHFREAHSAFKTLRVPKYVERTLEIARRCGIDDLDGTY
jgi:class 3 adenylate cyclase/tetratricopeptide (TPR) repeat protein